MNDQLPRSSTGSRTISIPCGPKPNWGP